MRYAAFALVLASSAAHADDPVALVARGDELAKQGEYTRAIELFKQADAQHPSAANACRIGLAYTRRELWPQAELFLARCHARATAADPTPDWFDSARAQLAQKLAEVDAAPIDVRIAPPVAGARMRISGFPPDEAFEPQAIHLGPGTYTITATAPGRMPGQVAVTVAAKTPQIVTLALAEPPPPPPSAAQRASTYVLYGAAGAALVGVAFHALASHERDELTAAQAADNPVAWDHHASTFERDRDVAIAGYGVALAAIITGLVLRHHRHEWPSVEPAPMQGGAAVWLRWDR